jgi:Cof subfamily protein (haloacid dehalogenase superfamily)
MIKLIVLDLDGTLLNSQHQISDKTAEAIQRAQAQGIQIMLATGKTRYSGEDIIKRFNLTTHGIYLQGASVHLHDGGIHANTTLSPEVARRIITFAEDRGFEIAAYSGQRILARSISPGAKELHDLYHEPEPEAVGPLHNILNGTPINKLLIIRQNDPRKIRALRWQLSMQIDPKEARMTQALPDMLEILPPNVSKGGALKSLLKDLSIKPEEVMAIGDAENDLEMIQLVGIGVAVDNAVDKLKEAADYVVASNDEDGVAEAIERFALKKEELSAETPAANTTDSPASNGTDSADENKAETADAQPVQSETANQTSETEGK